MMQNCLFTSRFIAFFAGCGDYTLSKIDKDSPLFVLCSVIVDCEANAGKVLKVCPK